jgi:hypothetical protein
MSGHDTTPEWKPGMTDVTGQASHPSMQKRTNEQLWAMLTDLDDDITESQKFEASKARDEYEAHLVTRRKAVELALAWRGQS